MKSTALNDRGGFALASSNEGILCSKLLFRHSQVVCLIQLCTCRYFLCICEPRVEFLNSSSQNARRCRTCAGLSNVVAVLPLPSFCACWHLLLVNFYKGVADGVFTPK